MRLACKLCGACLLLMLLAGTACLRVPARQYYQVRVAIETSRETVLPGKVLIVGQVDMDDFYDNYRIVYRDSPFQVNHYLYHLWFRKPTQMIRETVLESFKSGNVFTRVLDSLAEGDPDYILKTRVLYVEEVYRGRQANLARLGMELRLVDFRTDETVLFHSFDRRETVSGKRVVDLVEKLSLILSQEIQVFIDLAGKKLG